MKFFYVVVLLTGLCQCAFAQAHDIESFETTVFGNSFFDRLDQLLTQQDIDNLTSAKTASFESIGGTNRFFSTDWVAGGAVTFQNKIVRGDMYKYNYDFAKHELFAKTSEAIIAVNPDHLRSFYLIDSIGNRHTFYKFPAIGVNDFEELLSADTAAGKLKFVKQRNVTIIKYTGANANSALTGNTGDSYQDVVNYFILFPDNTAVKIKLSGKSFIENLKPKYQARANAVMGNLKKVNEADLAKLVNDINAN
jgi:hypothetical protein